VRYRITFVKDSPPSFEVVVYRDFEEPEGAEDESIMTKKITSIAQVHSKLAEEISYQSAFRFKTIEEVPTD